METLSRRDTFRFSVLVTLQLCQAAGDGAMAKNSPNLNPGGVTSSFCSNSGSYSYRAQTSNPECLSATVFYCILTTMGVQLPVRCSDCRAGAVHFYLSAHIARNQCLKCINVKFGP